MKPMPAGVLRASYTPLPSNRARADEYFGGYRQRCDGDTGQPHEFPRGTVASVAKRALRAGEMDSTATDGGPL